MRIKTIVAAALLSITAFAATAQPYQVAAGQDGRGYDRRAEAFSTQIREGWTVVNLAGSEDIARQVCAENTVPLGIAQIDAILQMETEGCALETLGIYPALEYAFIMFPPDGLTELHDLNGTHRVLVDMAGSGTALFWRTIVGIENGENGNQSTWSQATPVFGPLALANTKASIGDIDAVIMVTSPDSQVVQDLLALGWTVGGLDDKDIDDATFRRGSLYQRDSITIDDPNAYFNIKADAIVVRSYWIANTTWLAENTNQLNRLASIIAGIQ